MKKVISIYSKFYLLFLLSEASELISNESWILRSANINGSCVPKWSRCNWKSDLTFLLVLHEDLFSTYPLYISTYPLYTHFHNMKSERDYKTWHQTHLEKEKRLWKTTKMSVNNNQKPPEAVIFKSCHDILSEVWKSSSNQKA